MTDWHCEWQGNFPNTEITFPCIENQIKERRADILLKEFNKVVEIQHSKIEKEEVSNRKHDYQLHNIMVDWVCY